MVTPAPSIEASSKHPSPLRLITAYKFIKGGIALALALFLLILALSGTGATLGLAISRHLHHLAHPWAYRLADVLIHALSGHYLLIAAVALTVDGAFTLLEGWALHHGAWWGPWLVVLSTSMLLPPELIAVVRHANVSRGAILLINVAIVVYLIRHAYGQREKGRA